MTHNKDYTIAPLSHHEIKTLAETNQRIASLLNFSSVVGEGIKYIARLQFTDTHFLQLTTPTGQSSFQHYLLVRPLKDNLCLSLMRVSDGKALLLAVSFLSDPDIRFSKKNQQETFIKKPTLKDFQNIFQYIFKKPSIVGVGSEPFERKRIA